MRTKQNTAVLLARVLVPALAATLTLSACSGSHPKTAAQPDTKAMLTQARAALDGTKNVHFQLQSTHVPPGGTKLTGGEGVASRPAGFEGTLSVTASGSAVTIQLVSLGGKVYAKLPFSSSFQLTDPKDFGLNDPAKLIDPKTGISLFFDQLSGVSDKGQKLIAADTTEQIDGDIPGALVKQLLTSADPATPVKASLYITKDTSQLRQVVLTGPFFVKGENSTYTLVLDKYGDNPAVVLPKGVG